MNGVIGMIEVALDGQLAPEQCEYVETALRCAYSLLAIMNDIFDASKIDARKMVLEKIEFDVRGLLEECVDLHRAAATAEGVSIGCSVDSTVPDRVTGDPLRIRQIVVNLLDNVVKFTDRGEVRVQITASPITETTSQLRVDVIDTGSGIAGDKLPFIFDTFTPGRYDRLPQARGHGTGARYRTSAHRDAWRFGSGGKYAGARQPVYRPAGVPKRDAGGHHSGRREAPAGDASPICILVAEDNLVNQKVVTAILRKEDYEPVVAHNSRDALEALRSAPARNYFAMVLMDGLEAARAIRSDRRWADLPIIAMTAHAMAGDRDHCLGAGMSAFISKPVNPAHLIATVERYARQEAPPERAAAAAALSGRIATLRKT